MAAVRCLRASAHLAQPHLEAKLYRRWEDLTAHAENVVLTPLGMGCSSTMRIFSSAEKCRRVALQMSLTVPSARCLIVSLVTMSRKLPLRNQLNLPGRDGAHFGFSSTSDYDR